ncbi:MAG: hypothetical protein WCB26_12995, partial [Pseudolabrys sp.]
VTSSAFFGSQMGFYWLPLAFTENAQTDYRKSFSKQPPRLDANTDRNSAGLGRSVAGPNAREGQAGITAASTRNKANTPSMTTSSM